MRAPLLFLILQGLDIITTQVGLRLGLMEGNPFESALAAKIIVTACIAGIMALYGSRKLNKAVIVASAIVLPWNILNIMWR